MPTNAINDTGVKYLYDKLHGEIEPVAEAVSDSEVTIEGNPLSFNTLSSQNAKSTILSLEPIQDLHGYDKPWVGGAGKNKLVAPTLDELKTVNLNGTWNENKYTNNGVTFDCLFGEDDRLILVSESGTASAGSLFYFKAFTGLNGNYYLSGGVTNDKLVTFKKNGNWSGIESKGADVSATFETTDSIQPVLSVSSGQSGTSVFYPMLRLSTESDATFQPYTNIASISGRTEIGILGCGKNLLNPNISMASGYYDDNGVLQPSTRTGHSTSFIKVNPNTKYTLKLKVNAQLTRKFGFYYWDKYKNWISRNTIDLTETTSLTITTPAKCEYVSLQLMIGDAIIDVQFDIAQSQLEIGEQITSVEPYTKSNDLTISFGQTVYGGTLDVENGVLVVDRGYKLFNGTETWSVLSYGHVATQISNMKSGTNQDGICSILETGNSSGQMQFGSGSNFIYIMNASGAYGIDTNEKAQAFTNGMQICYPLATPTTINLTPHTINLLKGVNNISTDGDKIILTYRNGKVATLGDLTSAVDNLDFKIDESKILTDTVTGDKYILVVTNGVLSVEQVSD